MSILWARGDSNSQVLRHMVLSHARIPIPPRAHASIIIHETFAFVRPVGIEPTTLSLRGTCSTS